MRPFESEQFANPAAIHAEGMVAKRAVAEARTSIARLLNIRSEEIIFTASGSEADNLAILGLVEKARETGTGPLHIITTNIEHPAVLETCRHLEKNAVAGSKIEVAYVPVEPNGIVDPKKIAAVVRPETLLVSVQLANSEIGTIQPLRDIARALADVRKNRQGNDQKNPEKNLKSAWPYFHTDASQAPNYLDPNLQKYGVDMMTLDAAKIYGPKGIGLLAVKRHVPLAPIILGGGQERGLRAGTENVPAIIGFAEALKIAGQMHDAETSRLRALQNYFIEQLMLPAHSSEKKHSTIILNGDREQRLPNNINVCVPGLDAEFSVIKLDAAGIACSAASACTNLADISYSYVIEALQNAESSKNSATEKNPNCKSSSLRFTMGRGTTKRQIDLTLQALRSIISSSR